MKKILRFPLAILGFGIFHFPTIVGVLFILATIAAASDAIFLKHSTLAISFLYWVLKVYIGCAVITFFAMTTFAFQNCCIGMNTLRGHLLHAREKHLESLVIALTWPYMWGQVSRNLSGWGISWLDIILNVAEYWCVTIWKGVRIEFFNPRTGESRVAHAKTPEATYEVVKNGVRQAIGND